MAGRIKITNKKTGKSINLVHKSVLDKERKDRQQEIKRIRNRNV